MGIVVDRYEPATIKERFAKRSVSITVEGLDTNDYLIGHVDGRWPVERKTVNDLLNTYVTRRTTPRRESRLRWQLRKGQSRYDRVILLVEGSLVEDPLTGYCIADGQFRKIKYRTVQRLLVDLQRESVVVVRTFDMAETVAVLLALHDSFRYQKETHGRGTDKVGERPEGDSGYTGL